jgi:hypothetical protein
MREACRRARFRRSKAKHFYSSCFYIAVIGLRLSIAADKCAAQILQGTPYLKDNPTNLYPGSQRAALAPGPTKLVFSSTTGGHR